MINRWIYSFITINNIGAMTTLIGFYIVFVKHWSSRKPRIVKTIWFLLAINLIFLVCFLLVASLDLDSSIIWVKVTLGVHDQDDFSKILFQSFNGTALTIQLMHWAFAREYYKVSIKFQIILQNQSGSPGNS